MSRADIEGNSRISLPVRSEDKDTLMRAGALEQTDLTDFILRHALDAARKVIERSEHLVLSERDSLQVLDALDNPPTPNAKLLALARRITNKP